MPKAPATRPRGGQVSIKPARIARLLSAISSGNYIKTACAYAGVPHTTMRNWINLAEQEIERVRAAGHDPEEIVAQWLDGYPRLQYSADEPAFKAKGPAPFYANRWACVLFAALLEKASGQAEVRAVANVQLAGQQTWQASMTFLERRYPDRWGRRDRVAHEGVAGGAPIAVSSMPSLDDLEAAIIALAERRAGRQPRAIEAVSDEP